MAEQRRNNEDILSRLAAFQRFGSVLGLDRIRSLLGRLGDPHKDLPVIHVAGTNGKGSVCKYLYEVLRAHGCRVGLYISPYIECFHERIQCDGHYISQSELEEVGERVLKAAEDMVAAGEESPTEFEVLTAMAFVYFHEQALDLAILEVGLGGRGDSTNVVEAPLVTLITSIGYDHMDRLGDSLAEIAMEKAGIIKEGVPLVMHVEQEEARRVIAREAYRKQAPLWDLTEAPILGLEVGEEGCRFSTEIKGRSYPGIELSMPGEHQAENAVTALGAIEILRQKGIISVEDSALREGLKNARQPGRFELFSLDEEGRIHPGYRAGHAGRKCIALDGAHNPEAMETLLKTVDDVFFGKRILTLMGLLGDKAKEQVLFFAEKLGEDFITVEVNNPRSMSGEELGEALRQRGKSVEVIPDGDVERAVERALSRLREEDYDVCLFTGSLYLIGEIRSILRDGTVFQEEE